MAIRIGTQLLAPEGFQQLYKDATYHFLCSHAASERVLLIDFKQRPPKPRARKNGEVKVETPLPIVNLTVIRRSQFEFAVQEKMIVPASGQSTLPPWLKDLEGLNLAMIDHERSSCKKRHSERIDRQIEFIYPMVMKHNEIFGDQDPCRRLNEHARACVPPQNETRIRLWFFVYLLFGRNRYALHYPIHRIGHWNRDVEQPTNKRGRPSLSRGKNQGFNVDAAMRERILKAYRRFRGLGITKPEIYSKAMIKEFGCQVRMDARGMNYYLHPAGESFPSFGQFDYQVEEAFGSEQVQRDRLGGMCQ